ncbi:BatD family protein [Rhodanobacter sp. AS-Z3]|uniref:BatD family protein n=1 Tax=Rhodanobacter sp. AS-Z3 TaxID=3031330 RepID=UPI00247A605A|nr:BatD family protein [Rhodanobacter sp. AS-Z3]WEN16090.1 BatD family protein [Rhodanobacter sp. AS-Z3]
MTVRQFISGCLLALVLIPALAVAGEVSATLDRNNVQLGETVTLNVRVSGQSMGVAAPDLGALNQDFQILGTSQNRSLSVVNGSAKSELTFGIALRPRHLGTLQIPALSVAGAQTAPLQLNVTAPDPSAAATSSQDVFMESQLNPAQGYVGQQFTYLTRLYYANRIGGDAPQPPQVAGVEITPLGKGLNYDAERGGRSYHVLEQRYAVTPQHAGKIEIPPVDFEGQQTDPRDPDSFFGATVPVSASAPAQAIEVKPAPSNFAGSAWLPARALSLTLDGWPSAQGAAPRVGQPLNLSMTLQATGLSYDALPALSLPALDGATVYPDKPVTGNRQDGDWITGRRQQSFAIVPERAGALTIPAISLKWWNVVSDQMEVAQIPAHTITVLPAAGAAATPPAAATSAESAMPDRAVASGSPAVRVSVPWRWIALVSFGLWLFSLLGWWWHRRRSPAVMTPALSPRNSSRSEQMAFLAAARGSDSAAQTRSLLAWARAERPGIQHLGELSAALDDPRQRAAIARLQQRHYAGVGTSTPAGDGELAEVFKRGFGWRAPDAADAESTLAPLYPFKLR